MKCLPASKIPAANGVVIHDWHAEVLALRAFNRFVLHECHRLVIEGAGASSEFLRRRTESELSPRRNDDDADADDSWHQQPFAWRDDVSLHMYCSEAPCKTSPPLFY